MPRFLSLFDHEARLDPAWTYVVETIANGLLVSGCWLSLDFPRYPIARNNPPWQQTKKSVHASNFKRYVIVLSITWFWAHGNEFFLMNGVITIAICMDVSFARSNPKYAACFVPVSVPFSLIFIILKRVEVSTSMRVFRSNRPLNSQSSNV